MKKRKIKKNRKNLRESFLLLNYKEKVGESIYNEILSIDPTFNKQYTQWILNLYLKSEDKAIFKEDLYKAKEDLKLFYKFKDKLSSDKRDISSFLNLSDLYDAVKDFYSNPQSKNDILKEIKKEVDVLVDNENWLILKPLSKSSAILYGQGTRWCTASEDYNYFESYYKNGPLYILIDKKIKSNDKNYLKFYKYQFHFESEQFMDAEDKKINILDFFEKNNDLLKVFGSLNNGFGLYLSLIFGLEIPEYQKEIFLKKPLNLNQIKVEELPSGLIIHGDLNLEKSQSIKRIKDITIYGELNLNESSIEEISGKLYIKNNLSINDCEKFHKIPENFYVGGSFWAMNCSLSEIPHGNILANGYFSYNKIVSISKDLKVEKNFYINQTLHPVLNQEEAKQQYPNIKGKFIVSNV